MSFFYLYCRRRPETALRYHARSLLLLIDDHTCQIESRPCVLKLLGLPWTGFTNVVKRLWLNIKR